jgi:DMSO reductase family type II enzyme chaperone
VSATDSPASGNAAQYLAFARIFSYPSDAVWASLEAEGLAPPRSQTEREAEYMDVFELGRNGKAVPLYEGLCLPGAGREGILEELLRFYDYFGVKLSANDRDYPDHLVTELEFLAHLCALEQAANEHGVDAGGFRRAQRDFLRRHLLAWVLGFAERLGNVDTTYGEIAHRLAAFCNEHAAELRELQEGVLP